ncbi:putative mitochondrial carrier domain superfamily [Helianthus anomalus]
MERQCWSCTACTHCIPRPQQWEKSFWIVQDWVDVLSNLKTSENMKSGLGAHLSRDVPFSTICWSTLEPVRRRLLRLVGEEADAVIVLGANFSAGFVAGCHAAAACPLHVAKIEDK